MAQHGTQIAKVGIFTSGGDAPGMNAALRAAARNLLHEGREVFGIIGGYSGILERNFQPLQSRSLANIIQRGGTILKTARCLEFHRPEVRAQAVHNLREHQIDACIVIGGDGSFAGAQAVWQEHEYPMVGIPATIDNDIFGTDSTIGFDTAINTALEAIDRIRDTATSHDRIFIIEVMGRDSGFIASAVGLAGGAEEVFTPEYPMPVDQLVEKLKSSASKGKKSSIIVAAEGQKPGRAYDLAEQIRKKMGLDPKVCILGHQQRGGPPTAADRILATRMGCAAVQLLTTGQCDVFVGVESGKLVAIPFEAPQRNKKLAPKDYVQLASMLSH
ncbi:MAG: 6-phosphofructokinase [Bdellovibrio sp.]|nr:MAG: 6-phosphofructokinase [Bdellovibrio sp.]